MTVDISVRRRALPSSYRGVAVQRPNYTGDEPCTSIGFIMYFYEDSEYDKKHVNKMRKACHACPLVSECAEYAIHHERHGFWAGLTVRDRAAIRRKRGIVVTDPTLVQS